MIKLTTFLWGMLFCIWNVITIRELNEQFDKLDKLIKESSLNDG